MEKERPKTNSVECSLGLAVTVLPFRRSTLLLFFIGPLAGYIYFHKWCVSKKNSRTGIRSIIFSCFFSVPSSSFFPS